MKIGRFLLAKEPKLKSKSSLFWLGLSLFFSLFYSYLAWQQATSSDYIIQDDARQHVFWMLRFTDSNIFPNDLIADYFQSVAPSGYKFLYWLVNQFGIEPILFSKILPSILGVILTIYTFGLSLELFPVPCTAFVSSLLLNQNLWLQDGLVSGTPKAFAPPLLVAFLYYFLRRSIWGVCCSIVLFGLFYPSLVFVCCALLMVSLFNIKNWQISFNRDLYKIVIAGLVVAFMVLLPYAVATSDYAPTITVAQARELPEFWAGERAGYFNDNVWDFWFNGSRSSLRIPSGLMPPLAYLALLFPWLSKRNKHTNSLPTIDKTSLFPRLILASLGMFIIAHLVLFTLHLPSRYTLHTFRIIIIFAASFSLTLIWDFLLTRASKSRLLGKLLYGTFALLLAIVLIYYPHTSKRFVWTRYVQGTETELYEYLQQQPLDTMVASLSLEADNLPSFSQRSTLVSREYAIPDHYGYYPPFRQRAIDLIEAQYSDNPETIANFITKYNITHWLIEPGSFSPEYIAKNKWIRQHRPTAQNAIAALENQQQPIIAQVKASCSVYQSDHFTLLSSDCILRQLE